LAENVSNHTSVLEKRIAVYSSALFVFKARPFFWMAELLYRFFDCSDKVMVFAPLWPFDSLINNREINNV